MACSCEGGGNSHPKERLKFDKNRRRYPSYVKCGKIFNTVLPLQLEPYEPPIVLGEVTVNPKKVKDPRVLLQFSQFNRFLVLGLRPEVYILYRLVRKSNRSAYPQVLQTWEFEVDIAAVGDLDTTESSILYCHWVRLIHRSLFASMGIREVNYVPYLTKLMHRLYQWQFDFR